MHQSLSPTLFVHILAGVIAAFIAFPLALLAKKGSAIHVLSGKAFLIAFLGICATGYILDYYELKDIFFSTNEGALSLIIYQKPSSISEVLATASINTFAAYLAISGWRMAHQHYKGIKTSFDKTFDITLAALLIAACILFFSTGKQIFSAIPLGTPSLIKITCLLALISFGGFIEATIDILRATGRLKVKKWWVEHMRKMILAELGLILAFIYRCVPSAHWKYLAIFTTLFFLLLFIFLYVKMKNSKNKKLDP